MRSIGAFLLLFTLILTACVVTPEPNRVNSNTSERLDKLETENMKVWEDPQNGCEYLVYVNTRDNISGGTGMNAAMSPRYYRNGDQVCD